MEKVREQMARRERRVTRGERNIIVVIIVVNSYNVVKPVLMRRIAE